MLDKKTVKEVGNLNNLEYVFITETNSKDVKKVSKSVFDANYANTSATSSGADEYWAEYTINYSDFAADTLAMSVPAGYAPMERIEKLITTFTHSSASSITSTIQTADFTDIFSGTHFLHTGDGIFIDNIEALGVRMADSTEYSDTSAYNLLYALVFNAGDYSGLTAGQVKVMVRLKKVTI